MQDVSFNRITDAGALVRALAPLIDLTALMVEGNPISIRSFSSQPSAAETPVAAAAASIASTSAAAASGGVNGRVLPAGRAAASPARGRAGAATATAKAGQAGSAGTAGGGPGTAGRLSGPGRGAVVAGSQGARYAPRNSVGQAASTSRVEPSGQAVPQESASQGPLTVQLPRQLDGTSGQAALTNQEVPSTPACGVPVMRELLNRLPGLLACDDEEQTFSAPADPRASMAQSGKGGRCSNDGGENADDFVPSAAEMEAFRTRMGIRAPIPAQLAGKAGVQSCFLGCYCMQGLITTRSH